jgi:AraC family transcriptional regulator of adaptative response / DNA-3-methyladenine glycosylase II
MDHETCYRAVSSRDARFDGWFVTAVKTTGIYCRPSCPAMTPRRRNVEFLPTAAAAHLAGFRACRRCRPDASPGSPEWNVRSDTVARTMRLISDGVVDRDGVAGLAARVGYSERQLHRLLLGEVGAGPQALARAQRAHTARLLIETSDLPFTEVAFAAGFASIRQFNDTVRAVYAATPTKLRGGDPRPPAATGTLHLRLPARQPHDATATLRFLGERAVPGVESYDGTTYRRSLLLPHGDVVVSLRSEPDHVACTMTLADPRDVVPAVARCRRLLDLDADSPAIDTALSADQMLGSLVRRRPGLRVPGCVAGTEMAVRAVIGQQISLAGARTLAARLTEQLGKPLTNPDLGVTHHFPTTDAVAGCNPASLPMPRRRAQALVHLCAAIATGALDLDVGADPARAEADLLAMPGIGDPDVFLPTDLGARHALDALGAPSAPAAAEQLAGRWRPWRSYALLHLWSTLKEHS